MNFRPLALDHASKGYFVFPVNKDKIPYKGLLNWEGLASNDSQVIHSWWDEHPGALPAIAPGRSELAVIDLDQHPDKPNGFESLKAINAKIGNPFRGKSISGNGIHLWYRANIGSTNGIYPGVDRKASGGYVVAPYSMIPVEEHTAQLPDIFTGGGGSGSSSERISMSDTELDYWMLTAGDGPLSSRMQTVLSKFKPSGNEQMSRSLASVAALASAGHSGAFHAINRMLDIWLGGHHSSGDPEREFHASLRSAIERFGVAPEEGSAQYKRWLELTKEESSYQLNRDNLILALITYLDRVFPLWEDKKSDVSVKAAYRRCMKALDLVNSQEKEDRWMVAARRTMDKALGEKHV